MATLLRLASLSRAVRQEADRIYAHCMSRVVSATAAEQRFPASIEVLENRCLLSGFPTTTTQFGEGNAVIHDIVQDANGRLIAAGLFGSTEALACYDADGSLDWTFDTDGKLTGIPGPYQRTVNAVVMQGSKVIAAGGSMGSNPSLWIARYGESGGSPEKTYVQSSLGSAPTIHDLAVDNVSGKIIAVGAAPGMGLHSPSLIILRLKVDLSLDTGFSEDGSSNGWQILNFGTYPSGQAASGLAVAIDSLGRYVIAGSIGNNMLAARFLSGGSLDTSFNNGAGWISVDFGGADQAEDLLIDGNGRILIAGTDGADMAVARLTANGTLDGTFGAAGKKTIDFNGGVDAATRIELLGDGGIILGGYAGGGSGGDDFAIAKLTSGGQFDGSFSSDGKAESDFPGNSTDRAFAMINLGEEVLLAGSAARVNGGYTDFALTSFAVSTGASIVVSASSVSVPEGGSAPITVQLDAQPAADVVVTVNRTGGDADLTSDVSTLVFTPANWNVPQAITFHAVQDPDGTNGAATFLISATGSASRTISVTEAEDDTIALSVVEDSYVLDGTWGGDNYGSLTPLLVKTSTPGYNRETYLKFDISSLDKLSSAILRLRGWASDLGSIQISVYACNDTTWSEDALTWANRPTTSGSALSTITVSDTSGAWYEFDVSSFVQARRQAGATEITLVLRSETSSSMGASFISREGSTTLRPQLVTYSAPAAPENLTARGIAPDKVRLEWQHGSSSAVSFIIERQDAQGQWTQVATTSGTTYIDADVSLAPDKLYHYRVIASNGNPSLPSNEASAATRELLPGIDDFDPDSIINWSAFTGGGATVNVTSIAGHDGQAMQLIYDAPANGWAGAGLYNSWDQSQDWSGSYAISFWFLGAGSGRGIYLSVLDNQDPVSGVSEAFTIGFTDDVTGWRQIIAPFSAFQRADQDPTAPDDGFGRTEVWGANLFTWGTDAGSGSFAVDQIELTTSSRPAWPTILTASEVTATQVTLSWQDNADNEDGYRLEYKADGAAGWTIKTLGQDDVSEPVTGLLPETDYTFKLWAFNAAGDSTIAATTTATTLPPTYTVDLQISNLGESTEVTPGGVVAYNIDFDEGNRSSSGTLIPDNQPDAVAGHRIMASDSDLASGVLRLAAPGMPATTRGVWKIDVPAGVMVWVWRASGTISNPTPHWGQVVSGQWSQPDLMPQTYQIKVEGITRGAAAPVTVTIQTETGQNAVSDTVNMAVLAAPEAPNGLAAAMLSDTQIALSWTGGGLDVDEFRLEKSTTSNFSNFATVTIPGGQTTYTDKNLLPGQTYYYRIRSSNRLGTSPYSNPASASTQGNDAPVLVSGPTASPTTVTGTTTSLSVVATDDDGEANLTYTWSVAEMPEDVIAPTFSPNGTNAAKNATVTFYAAGSYTLRVSVHDGSQLVFGMVDVAVEQTASAVAINPMEVEVPASQSFQFLASVVDQFGNAVEGPAITWSLEGDGTLSSTGLYAAPGTGGSFTVTAMSGAFSASAYGTVAIAGPTIAAAASASPDPVTGTTTDLSVLGAWDGGEENLIYTWSTVQAPAGGIPQFSANGANDAKNTTVTFNKAGIYRFRATVIADSGAPATSDVIVTVQQTLTSLSIDPPHATVAVNGTQQFSAVASDQFGYAMPSVPVTWTLSGSGTIDGTGLYTAPSELGVAEIAGLAGSLSATATITLENGVDQMPEAVVGVPTAPKSLTPILFDDYRVQLRWVDGSTDELGFVIQQSSTWDFSNVQSTAVGAGITSYDLTYDPNSPDAKLQPGCPYYFRVAAANESGWSTFSTALLVTPPVWNFQYGPQPKNELDLQWISGDSWIIVQRRSGEWTRKISTALEYHEYETIAVLPPGTNSFRDTGLAEAGAYEYRLVADVNGIRSANSRIRPTRTFTDAPTDLTASLVYNGNGESIYELHWSANSTNKWGTTAELQLAGGDWSQFLSEYYTGAAINHGYVWVGGQPTEVRVRNYGGLSEPSNVLTLVDPPGQGSIRTFVYLSGVPDVENGQFGIGSASYENAGDIVQYVHRVGPDLSQPLVVFLEVDSVGAEYPMPEPDIDFKYPTTVTIPAGEQSAPITISILEDSTPEDGEIFVLRITPASSYIPFKQSRANAYFGNEAWISIQDDDWIDLSHQLGAEGSHSAKNYVVIGVPSDLQESSEDTAGLAGIVVPVNDDDSDYDGIPDFADGYGEDESLSLLDRFGRIYLRYPNRARLASSRVRFTYDQSSLNDPLSGDGFAPAEGALRLWLSDPSGLSTSSPTQRANDLADGGQFISSGTEYSVTQFLGSIGKVIYVEAVRPSTALGDQRIVVELDIDGTGTWQVMDAVRVTAIKIDLDADSDNSNLDTIPDRTDAEEEVEDVAGDPTKPGKLLDVNADDSDGDGIPDFADGFDLDGVDSDDDATESEKFVPLVVELPEGLDNEQATIKFVYSGSDPLLMTSETLADGSTTFVPAPGSLRLWLKDGSEARDGHSFYYNQSGDFIAPDLPIPLSRLPINPDRTITLWVEAVRPSQKFGDLRVEVKVDPYGRSHGTYVATDAVRFTAGLPVPTVVVNTADRDADGIADLADGFDANTLGAGHFVPVTVELPWMVDFNKAVLRLDYAASDPAGVLDLGNGATVPAEGYFRLWTRDQFQVRSSASILAAPAGSETGFFVPARDFTDQLIEYRGEDLTRLGFSQTNRKVTLYLEAVRPNTFGPGSGLTPEEIAAARQVRIQVLSDDDSNVATPHRPVSQETLVFNAVNSVAPDYSGAVRFFDGAVTVSSTDLLSMGYDMPWGHTRGWTTAAELPLHKGNGNGSIVADLPYLIDSPSTIIAVIGGQAFYFDASGDQYLARHGSLAQLLKRTDGSFVLVQPNGSHYVFNDFDPMRYGGEQGAFRLYRDAGGNETTAEYEAGHIKKVVRGSTTFTYDYYAGDSEHAGLISKVTFTNTKGMRYAEFDYYTAAEGADGNVEGNLNDLKAVRIYKGPVGSGTPIEAKFYRYYKKTAEDQVSRLKSVSEGASAAFGVADITFVYDAQGRVSQQIVQGAGASNFTDPDASGTYSYSYVTNATGAVGVNTWSHKTIETRPNGAVNTVYTNSAGQILLSVLVADGKTYRTYYRYDSQGRLEMVAHPSAVSGHDDAQPDLAVDLNDNTGLIEITRYYTAGTEKGRVQEQVLRQGESGSEAKHASFTYVPKTGFSDITIPFLDTVEVYRDEAGGPLETKYVFDLFPDKLQPRTATITPPTIEAAQNGTGSPQPVSTEFDIYGRQVKFTDGNKKEHVTEYDNDTGAVTKQIADSGGFALTTKTMAWDMLGRARVVKDPNLHSTSIDYIETATGRETTITPPLGPVQKTIEDWSDGTIEHWATVPDGSLQLISKDWLSHAGQVTKSERYPGEQGVTYTTLYAYDAGGRLSYTKNAADTVYETTFNQRDLAISESIAGTVFKTYEYDNNADTGDGNLTTLTLLSGGTELPRVAQFFYDWRNRLRASENDVQLVFWTLDNLGNRTNEMVLDASLSSVQPAAGGVAVEANDGLRAISDFDYDDRGRLFRTARHEVNPQTGALGGSLVTNTFYDPCGNVAKTVAPGGLTTTYNVDGAGRLTDVKALADTTVLEHIHTDDDANGNPTLVTTRQRQPDGEYRTSYIKTWYDAASRPTDVADFGTQTPGDVPDRNVALVTSYHYDSAGNLERIQDPRGVWTKHEYDALGRVSNRTEAYVDGNASSEDDRVTSYEYTPLDQVKMITVDNAKPGATTPETQITEYVYGAPIGEELINEDLLRLIKYPGYPTGTTGDVIAHSDDFMYNALGEVIRKRDRNGVAHTYKYDAAGRRTEDTATFSNPAIDATVTKLTFTYDALDNPVLLTSHGPDGAPVNQVKREYNGFEQLRAEWQEHDGALSASTPVVLYGYTLPASGSLLETMTYPNGRVVWYGYDAAGRVSHVADGTVSAPGAHLEDYSYLGLGTVLGKVRSLDADTRLDLTTGLDTFGRPSDVKWTTWTLSGGTWTEASSPLDHFTYGYDATGNVLFRRNLVNAQFSELYHPNGADSDSAYDALGRMAEFRLGTLSAGSDSITTLNPDNTLDPLRTWAYDTQGNRQQTGLTYDDYNRGLGTGYDYDDAGNTVSLRGNEVTGVRYDAWGRLTEVTVREFYRNVTTASGPQPVYDANVFGYGYDALGRMIATDAHLLTHVDVDAGHYEERQRDREANLYYSADGTLLETDEERGAFTDRKKWDLSIPQAFEPLPDAGSPQVLFTQYAWSPADGSLVLREDDAGARLYALTDAAGSTTALVDGGGAVVERYTYDPLGKAHVLDGAWAARRHSAHEWTVLWQGMRQEVGQTLLYADDRGFYDPVGGRLISPTDNALLGRNAYDPGEAFADSEVGFWEGLIPVWGNGKQAWYDFGLAWRTGDWSWGLSGLSNLYLAAGDAVGVGIVADLAARATVRTIGQHITTEAIQGIVQRSGAYVRGFARELSHVPASPTLGTFYGGAFGAIRRGHRRGAEELLERTARSVHDEYVQKVLGRRIAKETPVKTPWSEGMRSVRKYDGYDSATRTGFEGNTTPWEFITREGYQRKITQIETDAWLLRNVTPDDMVHRVIWFGTEALYDEAGQIAVKNPLARDIARRLQVHGIPYYVVRPQ